MESCRKETGPQENECARLSEIASTRAEMYDLLFDVFVGQSGDALLSEIKNGRFDEILLTKAESYDHRIREGARLVASCRSSILNGGEGAVVEELLVDRTRLVRATASKSFRPPYERLYAADPAGDGVLLQALNRFYGKAGLLLDDESCESPDFLFVELDFMKQLCLREVDESLPGRSSGTVRAIQRAFFEEHLGRWAGEYCAEAEKHAQTDFYRGFLSILAGFIAAEISYLEEQGGEGTATDMGHMDRVRGDRLIFSHKSVRQRGQRDRREGARLSSRRRTRV